MMGSWLRVIAEMTFVISLISLSSAARAQDYVLEIAGEPGGQSLARVTEDQLTIVDAQRKRFVYRPRPEHDSPDRQYRGYYCAEAERFLRWPVSGEGRMFTGTFERGAVVWRQSQMRARPAGGAPPRPTQPRPAQPPPDGRIPAFADLDGPVMPAARILKNRDVFVAFVDERGRPQAFTGRDGKWSATPYPLDATLPSGAPISLTADTPLPLPLIQTVDLGGELVAIERGRTVPLLRGADRPRFPPRAQIGTDELGGRLTLVDQQGRIVVVDPARGTWEAVERQVGLFEPGSHVALVGTGSDEGLLAVDRRGNLVQYVRSTGGWARPELIDRGLDSGTRIDAAEWSQAGRATRVVAGVDGLGRLRVWIAERGGWSPRVVEGVRLAAGAPVALCRGATVLSGMVVAADGRWVEWYDAAPGWRFRTVGEGFLANRCPIVLPGGDLCFAVDRGSRLVVANRGPRGWQSYVCLPNRPFAPQLIRRTILADTPLPPARVVFTNGHNEEVVARLVETGAGQAPRELRIPPGQSVEYPIERDGGGVIEEVYLVPGPLGELVEETVQVPIPPKPLYQLVVYANRVTSVYFDRTKNKSAIPDESSTSLVSLGVFTLPAGDRLQNGDQIDVYREAVTRRNPGAAALIDPTPRP